MKHADTSFTTHVKYEAGGPSGWRRLLGWDPRGRTLQQDVNPAVAVNRISSKSSKNGLLYKWGLKKAKNPPFNVQLDGGYSLTSDGYVVTNALPAYSQASPLQQRPATLKKHNTIPPHKTSTPEISPRKWKRHSESHSLNQYQHVPQSAVRVMATPAPSPTHLHRSSSTPHHYHVSGPAVPPKKTVRWADGEPPGRRRRSHSEPNRHHHTYVHAAPHHTSYDHNLAAYDQYSPTWEQYRKTNEPSQQQQQPRPSHSYSYSHPNEAQRLVQGYVIPRQQRKSVPYHLLPTPVIHIPQRG